MSSVVISGDTSGTVTVAAPAVAGTNTLTLQAATATNAVNTLGTAVASTSGTSIDFTSLPSWIKRITVMFNGVSTNGTSLIQAQLGDSGGIQTTGYSSSSSYSAGDATSTTGFLATSLGAAAYAISGSLIFTNISGNIWVLNGVTAWTSGTSGCSMCAGTKTLTNTLDRIRITTVNGTDTFDAGTVNILYEG